jgi:hypothetical protein
MFIESVAHAVPPTVGRYIQLRQELYVGDSSYEVTSMTTYHPYGVTERSREKAFTL